MALNINDIKFYASSAAGNLGGAPNFAQEVNITRDGFWDRIDAAESAAGDVEYRCLYVRNTSTTNTLISPTITLSAAATDPDTTIHIAVKDNVNASTAAIADEGTAPSGSPAWTALNSAINFSGDLVHEASGNGGYVAIWLRRTVLNANNLAANDQCSIVVNGQTTA